MKTMMMTLSLIAAMATSASSAFATSMIPSQKATLVRIQLDPHFQGANLYTTGTIQLDYVKSQVTLTLIGNTCPRNARCIAGPFTYDVTLPLVKRDFNRQCNIVTYVAQKDSRMVDGAFEKIEIVDNSRVTCAGGPIQALPDTMIRYTIITPGMRAPVQTLYSTFAATRLQ
jgi:hypothetical protein